MLQFPPAPMDRSSRSSWKPTIELAPNCPRCASSNTKFCYYNNYSLSQPRYFCKACRRYWTKGGSLRNVPVGGGCRKNRRGKTARHPQMNYTRGSSEDPGSDNRENTTNEASGADIDMAAVFAKFLNHNSSFGQELENEANLSSSSNLSSSLTTESVGTENDIAVLFESNQKQWDPITDAGMVIGEIPREEIIENFVGEDLCGIELQGLLGADDQMATQDQDVFWSDATASSDVTWQPPPPVMHLQELDYSMPSIVEDCQLPVNSAMNLINDAWSWSSFDLPTLEVFSRT